MHKDFNPPPIVITFAMIFAVFGLLWPMVVQDITLDYIPWLTHIVQTGPVAAFKSPFAAYNPPYLYLLALVSPLYGILSALTLIKLVALIGVFALALSVYGLLTRCEVEHAGRWAALVMLMPTVTANAGILGQSDALYVAPAIAALSSAIGRRHTAMLLWCGVSIAFKLQAILFAPFVVALLINRKVPLQYWLIPPAVFLGSLIPAWAAGWPVADLLGVYFRQIETFKDIALNAPNIWMILAYLNPSANQLSGLALTMAVVATIVYVVHFAISMPEGRNLYLPAILAVLITSGLLPHMHERYFLMADVTAFVFAIVIGGRQAWSIAILVQIGSGFAVAGYLVSMYELAVLGAVAMIAATLWVVLILPRSKRFATDPPPLETASDSVAI